jgi:hypothetical protein
MLVLLAASPQRVRGLIVAQKRDENLMKNAALADSVWAAVSARVRVAGRGCAGN